MKLFNGGMDLFLIVVQQRLVLRVAISICFFVSGLVFSSWGSRIPDVKDKYNLSEAGLGGVLFMLPLGALLALPIAGWLVHKWGSKKTTFGAIVIYAFLLFGIASNTSLTSLTVLLFCFGFIGNLGNIAMNTQGLMIQKRLNTPILSSLHAMWSLGAFAAAGLTGLLHDVVITTHFLLVAGCTLAFVLVAFFYLIVDDVSAETEQKVFVLPSKSLILLGIICFCVAMSEGAMVDWSSLYYRQTAGSIVENATAGYTAFAFCMALGRFSGDKLLQRIQPRSILQMNGLLILAGMSISLFIQHPISVMFGYALVGFGVSSVIPIVYILAAKNPSMPPSASLAAVSSVGFTGFLVGPPMIGFLAEAIGLRWALTVLMFLGSMIWVLSFRVKQTTLN